MLTKTPILQNPISMKPIHHPNLFMYAIISISHNRRILSEQSQCNADGRDVKGVRASEKDRYYGAPEEIERARGHMRAICELSGCEGRIEKEAGLPHKLGKTDHLCVEQVSRHGRYEVRGSTLENQFVFQRPGRVVRR